MTYEEALGYLSSLSSRKWATGLERMDAFLGACGLKEQLNAPSAPKFIQIAGTNGKGSTTEFVRSILVEHGFRTGAFFSPFVYDPMERYQFGRELITHSDFARIVASLKPIADRFSSTPYEGITEFEFKTAVGLAYFCESKCDWVALEVGLGGRLDATSSVVPKAGAIVSIGLDHTAILGTTHAEIAAEKAGILKPTMPLVVGRLPESALAVVEAHATGMKCPVYRMDHEIHLGGASPYEVSTPFGTFSDLEPGLMGQWQPHNMAVAIAAMGAAGVRLDSQSVRSGVSKASIPGRFERTKWRGAELILDGAHNPDAAHALAHTLRQELGGKRVVMVTAMMAGHEPSAFYEPLSGLVKAVFVAPLKNPRALETREVLDGVGKIAPSTACQSISEALDLALATGNDILVTGSFYLLSEVRECLDKD